MTRTMGIRRRDAGRSLKTWMAILGVIATALVFASPAFGWSQVYRGAGNVNPGGIAYSDNNANLHYNEVVFNSNGFGDFMQLTLCDTTPSCYPYAEWYSSFSDTRSISYGHAKCTAYQGNFQALFVQHCLTHNQ